ncbi:MAG: 4Fe-4S dicluster domain-containing protein [Candidatus Zixiibacteriota bacterium]
MPRVDISQDNCKGCGLCIDVCPKGCLEIDSTKINKMGLNPVKWSQKGCIGCGLCFYTCPEPFSITVYKKED